MVINENIAGSNGPKIIGPDHFRRKLSSSNITDNFPVSSIAILGDFNKSGFDFADRDVPGRDIFHFKGISQLFETETVTTHHNRYDV